ncbi:SMP-30/gluconolactonase/LRE family protein [Paracoccus sp. (in: a-proteobacteria)]|uniref:SMP-30/gluconolactonase/LRE family protein n=1 Tax=Paracoccus sp. TaxID=267 RepID=UPI00396C4B2B
MIFDDTPCTLGEGVLWHHDLGALVWFDILSQRLYLKTPGGTRHHWDFPQPVSAAGIVDADRLLIASATALSLFDLRDGTTEELVPLEADNPMTRSNDGRADPQGGFWIGTMGRKGEKGAGTIWRYHKGELRALYSGLTSTNSICFTPEGDRACFADTDSSLIRRVRLDRSGWPEGEPEDFIDLRSEGLRPDGAVIDAEGGLWSAQFGAGRVARYNCDGRFDRAIRLPASQTSCPGFGGPALDSLFVTSVRDGLKRPGPNDGCTFAVDAGVAGQPEHRVLIG